MGIFIIILIVSVIIFSIFNFLKAGGKTKKLLLIVNVTLYSIIALSLIFDFADNKITAKNSETYEIYHGGILSSLNYKEAQGDYYIIQYGRLMSTEYIAVSKENIDIPWLSKIYSPIKVYCGKNADLYSSEKIEINSESYNSGNDIIKIVPDYSNMLIMIGLIDFMILFIFNTAVFFNVISHSNKEQAEN